MKEGTQRERKRKKEERGRGLNVTGKTLYVSQTSETERTMVPK